LPGCCDRGRRSDVRHCWTRDGSFGRSGCRLAESCPCEACSRHRLKRGAVERTCELHGPRDLARLLPDDRSLGRKRRVQVVDEADRHPGHESELDVLQVLVQRVVEQRPPLQQALAALERMDLIGHQPVAHAPYGAGRDVADADCLRPGQQPDGHRALVLLGQARLQEVTQVRGSAFILQRHAQDIREPQGDNLGRVRNEQRHHRRTHGLPFARQVHPHDDAGVRRPCGLHRRAAAPHAGQQIAQARLVGELDRGTLQQLRFVFRRLVIHAEHLPPGRHRGQALQHVVHLLLAEVQAHGLARRLPMAHEEPHAMLVQCHLDDR